MVEDGDASIQPLVGLSIGFVTAVIQDALDDSGFDDDAVVHVEHPINGLAKSSVHIIYEDFDMLWWYNSIDCYFPANIMMGEPFLGY